MIRFIAVAAVLSAGTAGAGELAAIQARFDHAEHASVLRRKDIACVVCHPVGAAPQGVRSPAASVCHTCHAPGEGGVGEGDGLRAAPDRCDLCHTTVAAPASHAAGWLELHGADARTDGDRCGSCHDRSSCVDCHDRRQNGAFMVHEPSWIRTHGIAVRAAPASCDGCHAQPECLSCHGSRAGFGRTP